MLIVCSFPTSHLQHCEHIQNFLVQPPFFLAFVPVFVFLEVYFMIDKLSTEWKQTVPYYVNHLMTKVVLMDINCNPFVELESILLLCRGVLFCISSEISFRYFSTSSFRRSRSSPLNRFTKYSLRNWMKSFGILRMKCFRSLREKFWNNGRIETYCVLVVLNFCLYSSW